MEHRGQRYSEFDGYSPARDLQVDPSLEGDISHPSELQIVRQYLESYSCPLPSAKELFGYEEILTGAANRILKMSENTTNARNQATLADAEVTHAIAKRIRDDSKRADKQQYFFS